jgi:hypothetical protein
MERALRQPITIFHNPSPRSLGEVVDFYDKRFRIGVTSLERRT